MVTPIDQFTALADANRKLGLELIEIAQAAGQDYTRIGSKSAASIVVQLQELKPGTVPSIKSDGAVLLFDEIAKSREQTLGKIRAAFSDWQDQWKETLAHVPGVGDMQAFLPWLSLSAKAPHSESQEDAPTASPAVGTFTEDP